MTMFSDKIKSSEDLNNFFSNTFKNMRIPEREEVNPFVDELSNMVLKVIFKYSKHSSLLASLIASLLSIISAMSEHFNFHDLVLMMMYL